MADDLDRLRLENARLKNDRDQIISERNEYLSQFQQERLKNADISNQLLAVVSEKNDLKRMNDDLREELNAVLAEKVSIL